MDILPVKQQIIKCNEKRHTNTLTGGTNDSGVPLFCRDNGRLDGRVIPVGLTT